MEFKKVYTKEEVTELYDWFKDLNYDGPLDIGHGQKFLNAKRTIENIILQTKPQMNNPAFAGMIHILFVAKEELIKQGLTDKH